MIVISHIFWKTGEVVPIKEVIDIAHRRGIKVLVDGAQAAGSYPVNLHNINADFYCFPAHKWLYGPEGLGFLFVRKNIQKDLDIIFSEFQPLNTLMIITIIAFKTMDKDGN